MKKLVLLIFITLISSISYSQISFERGYFINNDGQIIECEIKNIDWYNNPTEFVYRLSEFAKQEKATIDFVKEFGVYNYSKYLRSSVDIDKSSNSNLNTNRKPVFEKEVLFLQVLVEGKSSLYGYRGKNTEKFFFNVDDSNNIRQLVFKEYLTSNGLLAQNNYFQQQLLNELNCKNITLKEVKSVNYKKQDLVDLFVKDNKCIHHELVNFEEKQKKNLFNLTVRPRLNSSSLRLSSTDTNPNFRNTDFGNKIGFGLGLEAELILPFNKNKWAISIEPTYQSFQSDTETSTITAKADYKSIEIPIGIRYYLFLNNDARFFINVSMTSGLFIIDFQNSKIEYSTRRELDINSGGNFGFGLGYKHSNRYSFELRFQEKRGVLGGYLFWGSEYQTISLIIGYSLF